MRTFDKLITIARVQQEQALAHREPEACRCHEERAEEYEKAAFAFGELLRFVLRSKRRISAKRVGTLCLSAALRINPDLLNGRSAADIERETQGRVTRRTLSKYGRQFADEFNFRSSEARDG